MKMSPWPECPQCRAKRIAVCPFCKTKGNDFPTVDMETLTAPDLSRSHVFYRADCYSHGMEPDVVLDPNPLALDWMRTLPAGQEEIRLESAPAPSSSENPTCSCPNERKTSLKLVNPIEIFPEVDADADEYPLTIQCPVCEEVLLPKFFDTCQACGYVFPDGLPTPESHEENHSDENFSRSLLILLTLLTLLGILIAALIFGL